MALYDPRKNQRNREWRRCVRVPARIKSADGWRNASILNVSSRGLLIHSTCCSNPGREVELRGGDQVIRARVVWRKGQRAGLHSDEVLPLVDIMSLTEPPGTDPAPTPLLGACRRKQPRQEPVAAWPRLLEQASAVGMGAFVVIAMMAIGATPLMARLTAIKAALQG
jgi:hypothetical protein